jgi:hypothetical protein
MSAGDSAFDEIDKEEMAELQRKLESGELTPESDFFTWRKAMRLDEPSEGPYGLNYGMIWIDVEDNPSSGCSWDAYSDQSNCDFVNELINAIKAQGRVPGLYTS